MSKSNSDELDEILKKHGSYAVLKDENRFDDEQMAREFPDELSLPEARAAILAKACDERVREMMSDKPRVIFEFETVEDRDKWYEAYSNSGEQEIFQYWYQDNEKVPDWKETTEN